MSHSLQRENGINAFNSKQGTLVQFSPLKPMCKRVIRVQWQTETKAQYERGVAGGPHLKGFEVGCKLKLKRGGYRQHI